MRLTDEHAESQIEWEARIQKQVEADPFACNECWRYSLDCECEE